MVSLTFQATSSILFAAFAASFHPPILGPCQGAALFAAAGLSDRTAFERLRDGMLEEERKNV